MKRLSFSYIFLAITASVRSDGDDDDDNVREHLVEFLLLFIMDLQHRNTSEKFFVEVFLVANFFSRCSLVICAFRMGKCIQRTHFICLLDAQPKSTKLKLLLGEKYQITETHFDLFFELVWVYFFFFSRLVCWIFCFSFIVNCIQNRWCWTLKNTS